LEEDFCGPSSSCHCLINIRDTQAVEVDFPDGEAQGADSQAVVFPEAEEALAVAALREAGSQGKAVPLILISWPIPLPQCGNLFPG
jgi:hypothetical protein